MEKFEEEKKMYEEQISVHAETVAQLLEHMQKHMMRKGNLPTAQSVDGMKEDLNFKKGQLENAENTLGRLKVELDQRKNDLEKINTLETRIDKEMQ